MKMSMAICFALSVSACATVATDPLTEALQSGFVVVDGGALEIVGDTGATYRDVNNKWISYLSMDGRKVVKNVSSGEITNRSWRINEEGVFCQELAASGKEQCESETFVYLKNEDGVYNIIRDGNNTGLAFTVDSGNTENF